MSKIPKKFFQTWETKNISPDFQTLIDQWKIFNPEYEYCFYDKNDRENFIKDNFEERVYNAYCKIIPGAFKADLWRYCVLYKYGGVYADIDTLCLNRIDNILTNDIDVMLLIDFNTNPYEGQHNLANGFICCVPNNDIMLQCIYNIVNKIENQVIPPSRLDFSGPGVLGRETNKFLGRRETDSFIGLEGKHDNIYFLKFEPETEYIKDLNGNILLQNKNGNRLIQYLYFMECKNLENYKCWLSLNPI